jgi:bacteriocin-like protein
MKHKLTHVIAGTLLSACMGITYAGDAPRTLGCIEYKVLSKQEMASITGGGGAIGGGVDSWRTNPSVSGDYKPAGDVTLQASQGGINSGGEF